MSPQKASPTWDHRHERATRLVAADELSDEQIAGRCKITKRQLERWKQEPEFAAQAAWHRERLAAGELAEGIAERRRRVAALNERWHLLGQVIDERAADPTMRTVPGGATGLLTRQYKLVGMGKAARLVEEYAVDTGLLRELRAHEEQAAKEVGQWSEKREVAGKDGAPLQMIVFESSVPGLQPDDFDRANAQIAALGTAALDEGAADGGSESPDRQDSLSP